MAELVEVYRKRLLPGFDDRIVEEQTIEILTAEITRMFFEAWTKLKKISAVVQMENQEDQLKKNIQANLACKLQELSIEFRKTQKSYTQQLRGLEDSSLFGPTSSSSSSSSVNPFDPGMSQKQLNQLVRIEHQSVENEREMRNILSSVNALAEIFKDLSTLVIDQGTILDRIDYNIEQTDFEVERAKEQLVEAEKSQKSGMSKKIILLLGVLVVLSLIVLIVRALVKAFIFSL